MKTNKSFSKRIRVTRKGKLLARRGGRNHFNAKERRSGQLAGRRTFNFKLKSKAMSRFLPG
ncbi:MAG: hypothetical protein HYT48_02685 [Candidatus Vogelbacteria bacterium]|nr:hypothetical protein [Candidatus Vogelbacteria bacterium]